MAAVRLALLALVAACGTAPREARTAAPAPAEPAAPDAGAEMAEPDDPPEPERPPPGECGRRTWGRCLSLADSLRGNADPSYHPKAVLIYRLLCQEGDDRGCFEEDAPEARRTRCHDDGLVDACFTLGELYRDGEATCPVDDACAAVLFEMVCVGGDARGCGAAAR